MSISFFRRRNRLRRLLALSLRAFPVLVLAGLPLTAFGQTINWTNTNGGNFGTASNWGGVVPGTLSDAQFSPNLAYGVTFTSPAATRGLIVTDSDVTFNLGGNAYSVLNSTLLGSSTGQNGALTLLDGRLVSPSVNVGFAAGSTSTLTVGSNAYLAASGGLTVGENGNGTFNVRQGGTVQSGNLTLGFFNGTGRISITGIGSRLEATGSTHLASDFNNTSANGSVSVDSQGAFITRGVFEIAGIGNSGSVVLNGHNSIWEHFNGTISTQGGLGSIRIDSGARMNAIQSSMVISNQGFLDVGRSGTLSIGRDFGPALTIRSGGSSDVRGDVSLTSGDLNGLRLESGGLLRQAGGSIVTTGFDRAGTFDIQEGIFAIERGVFNNNNAVFNLGGLSDVQFELRNGASTSLLTGVNIGSTNTTFARELNVLSGSTLTTSGNSSIGQLGSGSVLKVSGSGSTWDSGGSISVGVATGTLIVENSGLLTTNGNSLSAGVAGATSDGTLLIQSGGQVNVGNVELARVIGAVSNATVTGLGSQLNSTGIFVGGSLGSNGGTASLTIADGASVTVDGTTRIRTAGTLNMLGGSLATQNFTRDTTGVFNFGGGTLTVLGGTYSNTTGALTVAGSTAFNNPTLVLEGSTSTAGITALNVGSSTRMGTVTLNAGSQLTTGAATIASRGTLNLNGGTLSLSSFANSGNFDWSKGTVNYTTSATLDSSTLTGLLGSSHRLTDNQTLASSAGTLTLGSSLTVDGGMLRPSNLINNSTMTVNSGNVQVGSTFTNNASRNVQVNGTSNLSAAAAINNSGTIQLTSSTASLSGGAFANNFGGTLTGTGTVYNDVDNSGTIRVSGSEQLVLAGATNRNIANINLSGGTLEVTNSLFNRDGAAITGRGTFVGSSASPGGVGLTNDGLLSFSSGNTDIYGDVNQTSNGHIVTSGGGVTTFFDDVVHNGAEIRTFAGSRTVFLGSETGAGNFTGTGTVEFAGDLRPGNSPAIVSFEGNVLFNSSSNLFIELGGLSAGQFDEFQISGGLNARR